jgi:hypothetical protein
MPLLGLGTSLRKSGGVFLSYIKDGLKLYMPYKRAPAGETKFVGTGSTSFDTTNDYVEVADLEDIYDFGTGAWSVCVWVKITEDVATYVIFRGDAVDNSTSGDRRWGIYYGGSQEFGYYAGSGGQTLGDDTGNFFNVWTHVAYVRGNDTKGRIYINGILKQTGAADSQNHSYADPIFIGAGQDTWVSKLVKNVAIWERALTATEVQNVMYKTYAEVSGRLSTGLVSWWALDDADVYVKSLASSGVGSLTRNIASELTVGETYTVKFDVELDTAVSVLCSIGTGGYGTQIYTSGYITSYPHTSDAFTFSSGNVFLTVNIEPDTSIAYIKSIQVLDSNSVLVWEDFTTPGDWTASNATASNRYIDNEGSNHGTSGDGSTASTFPTHTYERYGQSTPVIPRGIDNAPTVQADAIGAGSALFDGADDYITIADSSDIQIAGDMSVAFWMKRTDSDAVDGIIVKRDVGGVNYQIDGASDDKVRMWAGGATIVSATSIVFGEWTHIAFTVDSGATGGCKIYINGVQDANTGDVTITANDAPLRFGNNETDSYFYAGNLCQVGIWDAILTQAQVQSIMEKTYSELIASETEDLVSYWALDDSVPALIFDGSGDFVFMGEGLNMGTGDYSVFAWIYMTTSVYQGVASNESNDAGMDDWHIVINGDNKLVARFGIYGGTDNEGTFGGSALSLNTWYHVGVTFDRSGVARGYINGVEEPSTRDISHGDGVNHVGNFWVLGGRSQGASNSFDGLIAQVGAYNKALSASEVLTQYNLKVEGDWSSDSGLIGYWKLDTASTSSNAITDLSANSNHGTVNGNPTLGGVVQDLKSDNDGTLI